MTARSRRAGFRRHRDPRTCRGPESHGLIRVVRGGALFDRRHHGVNDETVCTRDGWNAVRATTSAPRPHEARRVHETAGGWLPGQKRNRENRVGRCGPPSSENSKPCRSRISWTIVEADPLAVRARRVEGREQVRLDLRRQRTPCILDDQTRPPLRVSRGQAKSDRAILADRLHGVLDDVDERLLHLAAVHRKHHRSGPARREAPRDASPLELRSEERTHVLDQPAQVHVAKARRRAGAPRPRSPA